MVHAKSEVCKQLISLSFDANPKEVDITLSDALDLYADLLRREQYEAQQRDEILGKLSDEPTPPKKSSAPKKKADVKPKDEPATPSPEPEPEPVTFIGAGASEKKELYARLQAFREKHGIGSAKAVAQVTNGALTVDDVRAMMSANKCPLNKWKILGAALDHLEKDLHDTTPSAETQNN